MTPHASVLLHKGTHAWISSWLGRVMQFFDGGSVA